MTNKERFIELYKTNIKTHPCIRQRGKRAGLAVCGGSLRGSVDGRFLRKTGGNVQHRRQQRENQSGAGGAAVFPSGLTAAPAGRPELPGANLLCAGQAGS